MPVLNNASDKTRAVLDFLLDDANACLILIGPGGSGKTMAVRAALKALPWAAQALPIPCCCLEAPDQARDAPALPFLLRIGVLAARPRRAIL